MLQAASWYTIKELHNRCVSFPNPQTWLRSLLRIALLVVNHLAAGPAIEIYCSWQRLRYLKTMALSSFCISLHPSCHSSIFGYSSRPNTDNGRPTRCFCFLRSCQYRAFRRPSIFLEETQSIKTQTGLIDSKTEFPRVCCGLPSPFLPLDPFGQEVQPI